MLSHFSPELIAAASPTLLAAGHVNVVGLTEIREQAGPRWPRICDSVHNRMEGLLRDYLGVTDFFARIDDTTYLVTMPACEQDELNVICLHILFDLHRDLLGKCDLGYIQIARAMPGGGNTVTLDPLPPETIGALAHRAGIEVLQGCLPPGEHARVTAGEPEGLCLAARPAAASAVQVSGNCVVERHFLPVWNAAHSAVLTYLCVPKSITLNQRHMRLAHVSPPERAEIELACFEHGLRMLSSLAVRHVHFLLGVQISFEVLAAPRARREIVSLCRSISYEYRDYVTFVLSEVPPGVAQTRLANMVTQLKPFARRISATVAPHARSFSAYSGIGLHAIGIDLEEYQRGDPAIEDDAERLVGSAKKLRLRPFFFSIHDMHKLAMAHEAGIQYFCGNAVLPACDEPAGVRRLTWERLTDHHLLMN